MSDISVEDRQRWQFPEITRPREQARKIESDGAGFKVVQTSRTIRHLIFEMVVACMIMGFLLIMGVIACLALAYVFMIIASAIVGGSRTLQMLFVFSAVFFAVMIIYFGFGFVKRLHSNYLKSRVYRFVLNSPAPFRPGHTCHVKLRYQEQQGRLDDRHKQLWSRLVCYEVTEERVGTDVQHYSKLLWSHEFGSVDLIREEPVEYKIDLPDHAPVSHYGQSVWVVWEWQTIVEIDQRKVDKASLMIEVV